MLISDPLTSKVIGSHVFVTHTSPSCLYCLVEDDEFISAFTKYRNTVGGFLHWSSFQIKEMIIS